MISGDMRKLSIPVLCILLFECSSPTRQEAQRQTDSVVYPLEVDGGKKIVHKRGRMGKKGWEMYLDTVTLTAGELYRKDTVRHPLTPFYLSYPEWQTIQCIVAIDEHDYLDKAMIGLIERSGKLRISYGGKMIYLNAVEALNGREGSWSGTFKNDSMEIQLSGEMIDGSILGSLTGNGSMSVKYRDKVFEEPVYLVYEKK